MKITQEKPPFRPVTITLETLDEVKAMERIMGNAAVGALSALLYQQLNDILAKENS